MSFNFWYTGIKWYQFVRNDDVRRLTKQPKLTAIIQLCRLALFGHIMRMDDNADAKRIPHHGAQHRPTGSETAPHYAPEAADLAQNRPLWRMMSTYGAMQL